MIVFLIQQYVTDIKPSVMAFYKMPLCKWMFKKENSKLGDFTRPLQKKNIVFKFIYLITMPGGHNTLE